VRNSPAPYINKFVKRLTIDPNNRFSPKENTKINKVNIRTCDHLMLRDATQSNKEQITVYI